MGAKVTTQTFSFPHRNHLLLPDELPFLMQITLYCQRHLGANVTGILTLNHSN